jgi:hypothetical protein
MEIEGNLIIRWHETNAFELRFVATNPPNVLTAPRRIPDSRALGQLLIALGLPRERVVEVLTSPYVLHSLRLRVDRSVARRKGLIEWPILGTLRQWLRGGREG